MVRKRDVGGVFDTTPAQRMEPRRGAATRTNERDSRTERGSSSSAPHDSDRPTRPCPSRPPASPDAARPRPRPRPPDLKTRSARRDAPPTRQILDQRIITVREVARVPVAAELRVVEIFYDRRAGQLARFDTARAPVGPQPQFTLHHPGGDHGRASPLNVAVAVAVACRFRASPPGRCSGSRATTGQESDGPEALGLCGAGSGLEAACAGTRAAAGAPRQGTDGKEKRSSAAGTGKGCASLPAASYRNHRRRRRGAQKRERRRAALSPASAVGLTRRRRPHVQPPRDS